MDTSPGSPRRRTTFNFLSYCKSPSRIRVVALLVIFGLFLGVVFGLKDSLEYEAKIVAVGNFFLWSVVILIGYEFIWSSEHSGKVLFGNSRKREIEGRVLTGMKRIEKDRRDERPTSDTKHLNLNETSQSLGRQLQHSIEQELDVLSNELAEQPGPVLGDQYMGSSQNGDDQETAYEYKAITESEIRLLQIEHSTKASDPLKAKILHIPLLSARARRYVALSYTWDEGAATASISIDSKALSIRPNLEIILRKSRALEYNLIWVDAICINQTDIRERGAQVLRMQGIYAGAESVLVAIDVADAQAKYLLQILALADPALPLDNRNSGLRTLAQDTVVKSCVVQYLNNSYWRRIWIIQEFAIGHRIDLLIGDKIVDVKNLELLLQILNKQPPNQELAQVNAIFGIRQSRRRNDPIPLLEVLRQTKSSLCGRQHDRVYGLLGLVADHLLFLSEPTYETDVRTLAMAMTQSYIERRSLDIILLSHHHAGFEQVPSWCPGYFWFDKFSPEERIWSLATRHRKFVSNTMSQTPANNWRATGSSTASLSFRIPALVSPAYALGKIRSLGRAWSDADDGQFPRHDDEWVATSKRLNIGDAMWQAMLSKEFQYNPPRQFCLLRNKLKWTSRDREAYSFVRAFLPSYGNYDPEDPGNELQRWICANRRFFVGCDSLEDHARRLWPASFHHGPAFLHFWHWGKEPNQGIFRSLVSMAERDMRMMCLDDQSFGIGWAAKGARLHDEVFLLPGCSVPVILRPLEETGQYHLIGDAIVIGAMENEVWGRLTPQDLCEVEIV